MVYGMEVTKGMAIENVIVRKRDSETLGLLHIPGRNFATAPPKETYHDETFKAGRFLMRFVV
jgi:hypothetical protein